MIAVLCVQALSSQQASLSQRTQQCLQDSAADGLQPLASMHIKLPSSR